MILNRRRFLTGLGATLGLVAAEPVRRYWAVGATLAKPLGYTLAGGLFVPVEDVKCVDYDILAERFLGLTHDNRAFQIAGEYASQTQSPELNAYWQQRRANEPKRLPRALSIVLFGEDGR